MPDESALAALRASGVTGVVLPVGRVELGEGSCGFTLARMPDLSPLAGWPVTALVWVEGSGKASGDPKSSPSSSRRCSAAWPDRKAFSSSLGVSSPGLAGFATGVAARLQRPVELALPVPDLTQHLPPGGWRRVRPIAIAFGNPAALGFPASTLQDDLAALDALDETGVPYRAAVVVAPRVTPPPGPGGGSLAMLSSGEAAAFNPGERGSVFRLRKPLDWAARRWRWGRP